MRATKKLRGKPFGANLQMKNPRSQELAQLLVDERVGAITISGGSPKAHAPPAEYIRDPFSRLPRNDDHLYPAKRGTIPGMLIFSPKDQEYGAGGIGVAG